jgi:hypothetical protein
MSTAAEHLWRLGREMEAQIEKTRAKPKPQPRAPKAAARDAG